MRHRNTKAILNRPADHRNAMVRNLITSLFERGSVETTDARAKELSARADSLLARLKKYLEDNNEREAIRTLKQIVFTEEASRNAIEYAKKSAKKSGFVREIKTRHRAGDAALMVCVSLIDS